MNINFAPQAFGGQNITAQFSDPVFLAAIRDAMGLSPNDPIGSADAAAMTTLDLAGRNIQHTHGLAFFTGLQVLNLANNPLSHLDLSQNIALRNLNVSGACLDSLNLIANTELTHVDVSRNHLTELNLQASRNLQHVNATHNFFEAQAVIRLPAVVMTLQFNPQNDRTVTQPTCLAGGFTTWICGNNPVHTIITNEVPALGHLLTSIVTRPTFTLPGFTTHTCARCGYSFVDAHVPAIVLEYPNTLALRYNQATSVFADINRRAPELTWHSSNTRVLTVDQNGLVNYARLGRGTTIVTAVCPEGITRMTTEVTVRMVWWQWIIVLFLFGFIWY